MKIATLAVQYYLLYPFCQTNQGRLAKTNRPRFYSRTTDTTDLRVRRRNRHLKLTLTKVGHVRQWVVRTKSITFIKTVTYLCYINAASVTMFGTFIKINMIPVLFYYKKKTPRRPPTATHEHRAARCQLYRIKEIRMLHT